MPEETTKLNPEQLISSFKRDDLGLLGGFGYKYKEDNSIDWRAMVKPEHLYANPQNKNPEKDITKLRDDELVIRLPGLRQLGFLRGMKSVEHRPIIASDTYSACLCRIVFLGNYETGGAEVPFEDVGSASLHTTKNFGQHYLIELAANRAFCRCIRNHLGINIVSNLELGDRVESNGGITSEYGLADNKNGNPLDKLRMLIENKGYSEEDIMFKITNGKTNQKRYKDEIEKWKKLEDVPKPVIFQAIEKLEKVKT